MAWWVGGRSVGEYLKAGGACVFDIHYWLRLAWPTTGKRPCRHFKVSWML